jgi:uncharacterized protein YjbJ (UPF0337 family)
MSDRFDEARGSMKQQLGKVTGNREMEAEGKSERTSAVARRQVKGAAKQVKGDVKQGLSKATGSDEMRAEGVADRLEGDTQRAG